MIGEISRGLREMWLRPTTDIIRLYAVGRSNIMISENRYCIIKNENFREST